MSLRGIMLFAAALNLAGCSTWQATTAPLATLNGKKARVTMTNGTRLTGEVIVPDSMHQHLLILQVPVIGPEVLDSSDVELTEIRALHEGHTAGLILLGVGAVVLTIVQIQMAFNDPDY